MNRSFTLILDYTDPMKFDMDKLIHERLSKRHIRELFLKWVLDHKLFGRSIPDFLSGLVSHIGEYRLPDYFNVTDFSIIKLSIDFKKIVILISDVKIDKRDDVSVEEIIGLNYIPFLSKWKEAGCLKFKPSVYLIMVHDDPSVYVGSTSNSYKRLSDHYYSLRRGDHHSSNLSSMISATGNNFEVVSQLSFILKDPNKRFEVEQEFYDYFSRRGSLANNSQYAYATQKGKVRSEATIEKGRVSRRKVLHTPEMRQYMSESRKGKTNYSPEVRQRQIENVRRPLMGDGIRYPSAGEAGKLLNLNQTTVMRRCFNLNYPNWYYVGSDKDPNRDPDQPVVKRRVVNFNRCYTVSIDGTVYYQIKDVQKKYGVSVHTIYRRCGFPEATHPQWKNWFFVDKD